MAKTQSMQALQYRMTGRRADKFGSGRDGQLPLWQAAGPITFLVDASRPSVRNRLAEDGCSRPAIQSMRKPV